MKRITWRLLTVVAVLIVAVVYLLPTLTDITSGTPCWPHKVINLGLDLQGGMHLVLEVQTEEAVDNTLDRLTHELKGSFRKEHIPYTEISLDKTARRITIAVSGDKNINRFQDMFNKEFRELTQISTRMEDDTLTWVVGLPEAEAERIQKMATDQALETIRNRIDEFGVNEPDIRVQGDRRILIQLAGVKDPERAKKLIGRTAQLTFRLVDDAHDVNAALQGKVPPGTEVLYEINKNRTTGTVTRTPLLIQKRTLLDGSTLTDARVNINSQFNEPYVSIQFDKKGERLFSKITGENVRKRLAIVLDRNVYSAPVIQEKISGGRASITGNFTMEEARDLAIVLRAGALPATVTIIEERTVGPSLGHDSIVRGLKSMAIGFALVVLFMLIYYRVAGLMANIALLVNILLIAAGLAAFQATLTLPGIAGIILTIGMAVDANVLIFERIREELRIGTPPRAALTAGYERATLTILDANVTTLIAALVLFQFGSGPVKGFAVTLSLGVLSSLFTALILSRMLFDAYAGMNRSDSLSI
ncbi:MAG: protein translocase subunit SecD [Deltaproteobacteria bacterium]|nr:MAG: protein translocase subunit SecD [Deltaproteobacteria bacterium]